MKPTVFRYGLWAALTIVVLAAIHMFFLNSLDLATQEVIGYLTMLLSMVFVFVGIKHYRDRINGGTLSFGQGMKVGVLIVLIPAVAFGLFDILYTEIINPGWLDEYYDKSVELAKKNTAPDKLEEKLDMLQKQRDLFSNPVLQFLLMTATVLIIGVIVTIISALALRRQPRPGISI